MERVEEAEDYPILRVQAAIISRVAGVAVGGVDAGERPRLFSMAVTAVTEDSSTAAVAAVAAALKEELGVQVGILAVAAVLEEASLHSSALPEVKAGLAAGAAGGAGGVGAGEAER